MNLSSDQVAKLSSEIKRVAPSNNMPKLTDSVALRNPMGLRIWSVVFGGLLLIGGTACHPNPSLPAYWSEDFDADAVEVYRDVPASKAQPNFPPRDPETLTYGGERAVVRASEPVQVPWNSKQGKMSPQARLTGQSMAAPGSETNSPDSQSSPSPEETPEQDSPQKDEQPTEVPNRMSETVGN